jgi:hypothetical protein
MIGRLRLEKTGGHPANGLPLPSFLLCIADHGTPPIAFWLSAISSHFHPNSFHHLVLFLIIIVHFIHSRGFFKTTQMALPSIPSPQLTTL